jgi:hypothetical protein
MIKNNKIHVWQIEATFWTFIDHELIIVFHLYKFMKSEDADSFC